MRITLLPREVAARVITGAAARLSFSAAAMLILVTIPILIETLAVRGHAGGAGVPLLLLVLILVGIGVVLWRMNRLVVACYLAAVTAIAIAYQLVLLDLEPTLRDDRVYLLNRPSVVLVMVGVSASTALGSLVWVGLGFCASLLVSVVVSAVSGTPPVLGWGPLMVLLLALAFNLTLFGIQSRQRRRFPRFEELELATRQRAAGADLARRATALIHDTVLNDLAVIMNAPDRLDAATRVRLAADLETFKNDDWVRATAKVPVHDDEQATMRNELSGLVSDFRWRGLTVNVTGVSREARFLRPDVGEALLAALRALLENVLLHARTDSAEIEVVYSEGQVTFIVSDQGVGFDPAAVNPQRLGIRMSIVGRVEDIGGTVRLWSSPGVGTSVFLTIPVAVPAVPGSGSGDEVGG